MRILASSVLIGLGLTACAATTDDTSGASAAAASTGGITFGDLTFSAYHTQDAIHTYLTSEATKHPQLVQFTKLGNSRQGRAIEYISISHKDPSTVPAIYFNGTHHGDEWSSTESILGLADYLIAHESTDATVKDTLDNYAIYILPLLNPDGHQAKTREDSQGNDPNRDYEYPTGSASQAWKVPEIALQRDLLAKIKPHGAGAYHSGIEEVVWSWCYTSHEAPDGDLLASTGQAVAEAMGFDRYLQSYDDYPTTGEFVDYAYEKYNTIAMTFEVSTIKTPPASQLDGVVKNSIKGAMALIAAVKAKDSGTHSFAPVTRQSNGNPGSLGKLGVRTTPRLE